MRPLSLLAKVPAIRPIIHRLHHFCFHDTHFSLSLKEVYLSNASGLSSLLLTILACNAETAETLDRFLPFFILKVLRHT